MAAAPYSYSPPPFVVALQWTGANISDFTDAGYTSGYLALADDGTTLIVGVTLPGIGQPQYVPLQLDHWIVSLPMNAAIPDPLPQLATLNVGVVDPDTFAATYAAVTP
jgi:hypothetical protein